MGNRSTKQGSPAAAVEGSPGAPTIEHIMYPETLSVSKKIQGTNWAEFLRQCPQYCSEERKAQLERYELSPPDGSVLPCEILLQLLEFIEVDITDIKDPINCMRLLTGRFKDANGERQASRLLFSSIKCDVEMLTRKGRFYSILRSEVKHMTLIFQSPNQMRGKSFFLQGLSWPQLQSVAIVMEFVPWPSDHLTFPEPFDSCQDIRLKVTRGTFYHYDMDLSYNVDRLLKFWPNMRGFSVRSLAEEAVNSLTESRTLSIKSRFRKDALEKLASESATLLELSIECRDNDSDSAFKCAAFWRVLPSLMKNTPLFRSIKKLELVFLHDVPISLENIDQVENLECLRLTDMQLQKLHADHFGDLLKCRKLHTLAITESSYSSKQTSSSVQRVYGEVIKQLVASGKLYELDVTTQNTRLHDDDFISLGITEPGSKLRNLKIVSPPSEKLTPHCVRLCTQSRTLQRLHIGKLPGFSQTIVDELSGLGYFDHLEVENNI